jgi:hypothetical protein
MAPFLERRILVALLVLSGFAWGFVQLADEVVEGETDAFDTALRWRCATPPTRRTRSDRAGSRSSPATSPHSVAWGSWSS